MADLKSLAESRSALFNFDPRKLVVREGWNARDLQAPENRAHVEPKVIVSPFPLKLTPVAFGQAAP